MEIKDEYLARCKPGQMVLIGSRALVHYIPTARPTLNKSIDYDFIATHEAAMEWIATLGDKVVFEQSTVAFDFKQYGDLMDKDISQWKHWDSKLGAKLKQELVDNETSGGIKKILGHTDEMKFEIEIAPKDGHRSANAILKACKSDSVVAPLSLLEVIKTSHMVFSKNFRKHMADLHLIRDRLHRKDAYMEPNRSQPLVEIMYLRRIEHCLVFGVPGFHINLNKTNAEFLETDSVIYTDKYILHDDLHLKTCFGKVPAYDNLRLDKSKAMMYKGLFDKASTQVRLNCVREEAMTIALERYLLPGRSKDAQDAYEQALLRVCTTLTKGWFREFAINSHFLVKTIDKSKNLIAIRDEILMEYEQRQHEAKIEAERLEDRKRSRSDLLIKAPYQSKEWKIEHIFPMIFEDADELDQAREMAKHSEIDGDGVYHCEYEEYNFYWKIESGYYYDNRGWCESFNRWYAFVNVATDSSLEIQDKQYQLEYGFYDEDIDRRFDYVRRDPINYLNMSYSTADRKHEYCVFSATMAERADNSVYSELHPTVYSHRECKSLDDISNDDSTVTPEFLMKLMIAISFPSPWSNNGHGAWPTTDFHFMYDAWNK